MLTASAPGKLLILGEYAVLDGAPAVVQAVDRRARVRLRRHGAGMHQVRALPIRPEPSAFDFAPGGALRWRADGPGRRLAYVEALLSELGPQPGESDRFLDIELDTRDFFSTGATDKLGLGSSAALTVALAAAWRALGEGPDAPGPELDTLIDLHRHLQGGRGSGADVAASLHGGLIVYRQGETAKVEAVAAVPGLEWMWIWLGRPAATPDFLAGIENFRAARPEACRRLLQALADLAEAGVRALERGDAGGLLAIVESYGEAMAGLGEAAALPIWTADHRRLAQWAVRRGVAFKPSGAGGGDFALAAGADVEALAGLARQAQSAGYRVLPLAETATGLRLQWHDSTET